MYGLHASLVRRRVTVPDRIMEAWKMSTRKTSNLCPVYVPWVSSANIQSSETFQLRSQFLDCQSTLSKWSTAHAPRLTDPGRPLQQEAMQHVRTIHSSGALGIQGSPVQAALGPRFFGGSNMHCHCAHRWLEYTFDGHQ